MCGALLWVTLRGKDAFPFSHYPMFAQTLDLQKVRITRIALELESGDIVWWQPEFLFYREVLGKQLNELYPRIAQAEEDKTLLQLEKKSLLLEAKRLIASEKGNDKPYRAFHIVECGISENFEMRRTIIDIVPFSSLTTDIIPLTCLKNDIFF